MRTTHYAILSKAIDEALIAISEEGNPEFVYDELIDDMTDAAACVYDACMRGQAYANANS